MTNLPQDQFSSIEETSSNLNFPSPYSEPTILTREFSFAGSERSFMIGRSDLPFRKMLEDRAGGGDRASDFLAQEPFSNSNTKKTLNMYDASINIQ